MTPKAPAEPLQVTWRVAGPMTRRDAEAEIRRMHRVNPQGFFLLRESTKTEAGTSSLPVLSVCVDDGCNMKHHHITVDVAGIEQQSGDIRSNLYQFE